MTDWLNVICIEIVSPILYVPFAVLDVTPVTVGTTPSTTIAFAPAMLLAPVGNVVAVIALPAASNTEPTVNALAVRSAEASPA